MDPDALCQALSAHVAHLHYRWDYQCSQDWIQIPLREKYCITYINQIVFFLLTRLTKMVQMFNILIKTSTSNLS